MSSISTVPMTMDTSVAFSCSTFFLSSVMAAFNAIISSVDPWLCSHITILAARESMVVLRGVIPSVKAIQIMSGTEASRLAARRSAERASCLIQSRDIRVSGSWETAAIVVGLGDCAATEEPGVSAGVSVAMDIPEGPGAGVGRDVFAGDDSVLTNSITVAFFLSA
uniref:Uncharacterized protein n=1 Tax=Solanum tuberosum TaxID=4113 RepID=M1DWK0_SOLTU